MVIGQDGPGKSHNIAFRHTAISFPVSFVRELYEKDAEDCFVAELTSLPSSIIVDGLNECQQDCGCVLGRYPGV